MKPGAILELLEPEEFVGKLWHGFLGRTGAPARYPEAAVTLEEMRRSSLIVFRSMGGLPQLAVMPGGPADAAHRPGLRERIGGMRQVTVSRRDDEALYLPPVCDFLPTIADNRSLYIWLAAFFAHLPMRRAAPDTVQRDIAFLRDVRDATAMALESAPGLKTVHVRLCSLSLQFRPRHALPPIEAAVESAIRALLGENASSFEECCERALAAEAGRYRPSGYRSFRYRPFLPVMLWGRAHASMSGTVPAVDEEEGEAASGEERQMARKASRQEREQTERQDYLALNRFEKMLTMADSMNIARPVDDDERESARQAAEDSSEIILSRHGKRAATRLKLELELPTAAMSGGELAGGLLYPEWDWRRRDYRQAYCRIVPSRASVGGDIWHPSQEILNRARALRRQFRFLQPRNITLRAQVDGDELDLEALVRTRADIRAGGIVSDRNHLSVRRQSRDLAVALLVDASLSTDSWVEDRRVIDIAREAAFLFGHALDAGGDTNGVFSFSSNGRQQVRVDTLKDFAEPMSPRVVQRMAALKPAHYTRLGAALRHVAAEVAKQEASQRLLLVLTDGKPNDIDHYEGRFGVEDTRRAVREARHSGVQVFGLTIDIRAQAYFPVLFGKGGYAIVSSPARLPMAVPKLLRQVKLQTCR